MLPLSDKIKTPYVAYLRELRLPDDQINASLEWLQYYLDFCSKYRHPVAASASLALLLKKLEEKKQSEAQRAAAEKAVRLFLQLIAERKQSTAHVEGAASSANSTGPVEEHGITQTKSGSWVKEFKLLAEEIKLRHFSPHTLKSNRVRVSKFQAFVKRKSPQLLDFQDVRSSAAGLPSSACDSLFAQRVQKEALRTGSRRPAGISWSIGCFNTGAGER
jgi:hypothetical protein